MTLAALESKGSGADTDAARTAYRARSERGAPGRSRDAHLHVGHDRRAEGRDADARQHLLERRWRRAAQIPFAGNDVCLSFLPLSHIFERMAGHYLMFARGTLDRVRRVDRHRADQHAGGAPDDRALRAATVREDVRARARERAGGRRGQEAHLLLGARRRRAVGRREARRRHAARIARAAVRASRRGSCSRSCRRARADGSATSCPAARRSRRRSTSSSTRRGW